MISGVYCHKNLLNRYEEKWINEYLLNTLFCKKNSNLNEFGRKNLINGAVLFNEIDGGHSKLINETHCGFKIRNLNNESDKYMDFAYWSLPKIGDFHHGDVFTFSFWAKGTQIQAFLHGHKNFIKNKILNSNGFSNRNLEYSDGCTIFNLTKNWKRYYVTWKLDDVGDLNVIKTLLLRVDKGNEAYVSGVKFEKGDLFTNYSNIDQDSFHNFLIDNSYQIIKDSNVFDEKGYIDNYIDIKKLDLDPISHYLLYGHDENCSPNVAFNEEEYLKNNGDLNGLNPFVHYILYNDGHIASEIANEMNKYPIHDKEFSNIINVFEKGITIIIPIYNAYDDTKKCIESVLQNTTIKFNLILIDDKSTDLRISKLLDKYEEFPNVKIIRNEINKGFTRNVNLGISETDNDVILLNSDTIVTPRWVQKIIIAAYSEEDIGTLTPISNASDISVPIMNKNNNIPSFLNVNSMSYLVEKSSINGNLIAPTGNGFCLFIKRDTINDVGLFDEKNFGKGYGEESDFTSRAKENGWKNVRNDSIFIYHKRSASFSLNKANNLKQKHGEILAKKHPTIFDEWRLFVNSDKLVKSIESIKYNLDNFHDNMAKKNILYITDFQDNIPNIDNVKKLAEQYNIFSLAFDSSVICFYVFNNDHFIKINEIELGDDFKNLVSLNCFYLKLLNSLNIDNILFQFNNNVKFLKNSPYITPIKLASKLGIPIFYGKNSNEFINQSLKQKSNRDVLLDNIINENDKGVVYTAIFGNYEDLLDPKFINEDLDYICFTDNPNLKSDIWEVRLINEEDLDNVRKARKVKILPHKYLNEYDYSLWVDAGFQIIGDIKQFINMYSTGKSFMSCIHTNRDCIYDEAHECLLQKKDDENLFKIQTDIYKKNGFPEKYGLIESGVIFRKHNDPNLIKAMEDWCSEVINYTNRDQISLPYVLWENNLLIDKYKIFYWKNPYFEHFYHQNFDSTNVALNKIHIFIIECDYENSLTNKTILNIKRFQDDIPISVIKSDELNNQDFNTSLMHIDEDFILFLKSGDLIKEDFFEYIYGASLNDLSKIGAVIFNYVDYYSTHNISDDFYNHESIDDVENNVLINKNAILSIGGFDLNDNLDFIKNSIKNLKENNFIIITDDTIAFKLTSYKNL